MSTLTTIEKLKLEKIFNMGKGYVLDFFDRSFQSFIAENTNLNIEEEKYKDYGTSKANRLRALWNIESDAIVGKLTKEMIEYWRAKRIENEIEITLEDTELEEYCLKIAGRLLGNGNIENLDSLNSQTNEKDFNFLAKLIRESVHKNEPEAALDRLHTYMVRFIRSLCLKHNIEFEKEQSLNSIFGKYVKYLKSENLIESLMAENILKFSIDILESYNKVRNDHSYAHDNQILNYQESLLILNNIINLKSFVDSLEKGISTPKEENPQSDDDLPF